MNSSPARAKLQIKEVDVIDEIHDGEGGSYAYCHVVIGDSDGEGGDLFTVDACNMQYLSKAGGQAPDGEFLIVPNLLDDSI